MPTHNTQPNVVDQLTREITRKLFLNFISLITEKYFRLSAMYSYNDGPPKAEVSIRSNSRGICGEQCDMKQMVFRILNLFLR